MLKVHGDSRSGNCYKVKLLLAQLGLPFEWQDYDVTLGTTRTAAFLAMNPNGRLPLLEITPGEYLAESNAILWYLAEDSDMLPDTHLGRAHALQWMFFEQYSHEPYIATSRYWMHLLGEPERFREQLEARRAPGYAALAVMEQHLARQDFLAGGRYSVADIALYAYTHVAHEGGFSLDDYPALRAWLERVKDRPAHVEMSV